MSPLTKAEDMALDFLKEHGPHTMGPIDTDEQFCAALSFIGLVNKGMATSTDFGGGNVQYALSKGVSQ